MDEHSLYQIIKKLLEINRKNRKIVIYFHGGEPLLNFSILPRVYDELGKEYPELRKIPGVIVTNLSILYEPGIVINFCKKNNFTIMVSYNPQPESRMYKNGKNSHLDVLKNLLLLNNAKIPVVINSTLTNGYMFELLKQFAEFVSKYDYSWNLNPELSYSGDVDKLFSDVKFIINILRHNNYDLNKFNFYRKNNIPPRIPVGINFNKDVFVSLPYYSEYLGKIDNISEEVQRAMRTYNGFLCLHNIPDKCKLCHIVNQCCLTRCYSTLEKYSYYKNNEITCKINLKVSEYLLTYQQISERSKYE
jgi:sulfatase maturation enzyme AslB (radical SAM superfamily)